MRAGHSPRFVYGLRLAHQAPIQAQIDTNPRMMAAGMSSIPAKSLYSSLANTSDTATITARATMLKMTRTSTEKGREKATHKIAPAKATDSSPTTVIRSIF